MNQQWVENKSKERLSINFVRTALELSGYKVMNFGIENHNQEIIDLIKKNTSAETNKRLRSMPDFVVVDEETKESWLIEVKYRARTFFNMGSSYIQFRPGTMKNYLDFWKDATLVVVFNVKPFCLCIDFNKIDWAVHFKEKSKGMNEGYSSERWMFSGIYQPLNKKFPKVSEENFIKALRISRI